MRTASGVVMTATPTAVATRHVLALRQRDAQRAVDKQRRRADDHRARFDRDVLGRMLAKAEREGRDRDRRRGSEHAGERFGFDDLTEEGECRHDRSTEEKPYHQLCKHDSRTCKRRAR